MIELNELLQQIWPLANSHVLAAEEVPIQQALGRVLAQAVHSTLNVPQHDNSSMDGYAVNTADFPSLKPFAVSQRIAAGHSPDALMPGTVARIFTGAPIPKGANAVIMQEEAELEDGGLVSFKSAPSAGQWVRYAGEDIAEGQVVLAAGEVITPFQIGLLASIGIPTVRVFRRLKVGVLVTGSELVNPGQPLQAGQIYNSNEFVWVSMLQEMNVDVHSLGIVQDRLQDTADALQKLSDCDLVISSGGVSEGEEDHIKPAVERVGQLRSWKVAAKPGKPMAFGHINRKDGGQCWFFGMPGNPVSSAVTFLLVVRPFLAQLMGQHPERADWRPKVQKRKVGFEWLKPDSRREEFVRVKESHVGGPLQLFPNQSSGVLTSMNWATGLARIPKGQVILEGEEVDYLDFRELTA
ncbi:MAG: molybdopterin molybdotransferase MoeA [Limnobacter sp.]|nr:molybdopterin molybdotransferase MoeA [Limnobacter sp.]